MTSCRRVFAAVVLASLVGCATTTDRVSTSSRPPDWAAPYRSMSLGRWVRVEKAERRLTVFEDTEPIRSYPVVLGGDPLGAKLYEGDNRTPEGEYRIQAKFSHPRWSRFLLLDYPRESNRLLYESSRESGLLPGGPATPPGIGGEVGIHGTVSDVVNRQGENWTRGCVSLMNRHVEELYTLVDVGTRVVIEK